jgi:hypothetical protein
MSILSDRQASRSVFPLSFVASSLGDAPAWSFYGPKTANPLSSCQGNQRERIVAELDKFGYKIKRVGG